MGTFQSSKCDAVHDFGPTILIEFQLNQSVISIGGDVQTGGIGRRRSESGGDVKSRLFETLDFGNDLMIQAGQSVVGVRHGVDDMLNTKIGTCAACGVVTLQCGGEFDAEFAQLKRDVILVWLCVECVPGGLQEGGETIELGAIRGDDGALLLLEMSGRMVEVLLLLLNGSWRRFLSRLATIGGIGCRPYAA